MMVKRIACLLLGIMLLGCSLQPDAYDSEGNPIKLRDYRGQWIIINYWASWCAPCLSEMAALNKISQDYKNKIIVLGVSFEQLSDGEIEAVRRKFSIHYPMLSKFPIEKFGINNLGVLPITFIIDPKGHLVKILKGPQTEEQFLQAIKKVAK